MEKTLLQKAKEIKVNRRLKEASNEEMDLYVAWLRDEVTSQQVIRATSRKYPANMLSRAAGVLKSAYRAGKIK